MNYIDIDLIPPENREHNHDSDTMCAKASLATRRARPILRKITADIQEPNQFLTLERMAPKAKDISPIKGGGPAWSILEAQSPDHLECYHCETNHLLSDLHKFIPTPDKPAVRTKCMEVNKKHRTAQYIHPNFHFTALRMIMKLYRQGKDCTEHLKLLSYRSGVLVDGTQVKQITASAKILEGRLMMRVRTAYVVPPSSAQESRWYLANMNHLKCPHSHRYISKNCHIALKILRWIEEPEKTPKDCYQIMESAASNCCFTFFDIALARFEGDRMMLIVSKSIDLGTGLSPLESDMPRTIKDFIYIREDKICQRWEDHPMQFRGHTLDFRLGFTLEESEDLFQKSESKVMQKKRAREAIYWRCLGRGICFPHQYAAESEMEAAEKKAALQNDY